VTGTLSVFDLRYHVASLAAVFFALVIGILVGVALVSHGLGNTERKRLERAVDVANARAESAQDDVASLKEQSRAAAAFVDSAYDAVMTDRLHGKRIAVLFVGSVDGNLLKSINRTLSDSDAGSWLRLRAITVPLDETAIDGILDRRPLLAAYAGAGKVDDLGRALADEFAVGGETPLWDALENHLVEERNGTMRKPADGIVVVRTAQPQMGRTARFLHGLLSELGDRPVPVVGVETSVAKPSAVPVYRRYSISSVDDIDDAVGRVAAALLLSDAPRGSYGTKRTATDGVLPEVTPVPVTATGG
jgi:Copper transport outer membrane protein, MctB